MHPLAFLGFCFLIYNPGIWTQYLAVLRCFGFPLSQAIKDRWLGRIFIYSEPENFQRQKNPKGHLTIHLPQGSSVSQQSQADVFILFLTIPT